MPPKFKIKPSAPRPAAYAPRPGSAVSAAAPASTPRPGAAARSSGRTLVIVESPAKCQKIEGYLGKDKYTCLASFGHIREIADGLKSIDVDREFAIKFAIMSSKQAQVAKLRAAIADASEVILATDDDREGEAIAWHLCQVFHLSVATTKRIIFHEITEPALRAAVAAPRTINMSLVLAQQARQVLDLIVGYKISPVLWTYVAHTNLSAGRCQTPALRLVYENYKEIEASKATMVYTVSGIFTKLNLTFHLSQEIESTGGSSTGDSSGEETLERFIRETAAAPDTGFRATVSGPAKKTTKPPPRPYTTSTLQQASSNDLHLSPKDTMSVAQKLYEGGYITYMRTDSKVYSAEFVAKACEYIRKRFGGEDLIGNLSGVSSGAAAAAAAHEAIRPTDISRTLLPQSCHPREHRLYSIIHRNTLESLMAPAICQSLTMAISSPVAVVSVSGSGAPTACEYRYTAEQVIKPGWKLVAGGYDTEAKEYTYFASLAAGAATPAATAMPFKRITTKCSLRNTKSHYTESGLVQMLEKMGIGRPSTFSSLIDKIQERGYVKLKDVPGKPTECREFVITKNNGGGGATAVVESKTEVREIGGESRKLVIQPLGIIVIEFLLAHFAPLFEYEFTQNMENQLDEIATDGMVWHELCYKCWFDVAAQLQELKDRGVVKEEIHIDDRHSYIMGKNGPVIRCRVADADNAVSETIHSGDDDDDTDADTDADLKSAEKKPKFIFKSVRPNLEYAKIQRGEYSLAYMLGEAEHVGGGAGTPGFRGEAEVNEGGAAVSIAGAAPAPVSVAGGGRLMGQYQGQDIVTKSGKYGAYVVWGSMNLSLKPLLGGGGRGGGKSEFDLKLQDVIAFIEKSTWGGGGGGEAGEAGAGGTPYQGQILRTIDENTTIRYGRYGPYIFHKTAKMTKPAFIPLKGFPEAHGNYITCDVAKIHEWITADAAAPAKPKPKFGFFKKK
jgi:DNA topoisomerase-1